MKIRTFHSDINKFCRVLFSGMSCGGFCGTFRNLWLNYIFSCNRKISAKMRLFLRFWLRFLEIPQRKTTLPTPYH